MRPKNKYYGTQARERIIEAMLMLLESSPFDKITILQITQEAAVSRRTFYLYYKSKQDILDDYYDALAKEYYAGIAQDVRNDYRAQAKLFFNFWKQHKSYLMLLNKNNLTHILFAKFDSYLMEMTGTSANDEDVRYYSAFFAGGLWAILFAWIRYGFRESPEELAEVASKFESLHLFSHIPE